MPLFPGAAIDALFSAAATCTFKSLEPPRRPGVPVQKQRSRLYSAAGSAAGAASPPAAGSPGSDTDGSPGKQRSLTSVLARMRRTITKRMGSASASPELSPEAAAGSLQAAAELGAGGGGGGSALPPIAEVALSMAAPQPPPGLASLEEAEAWLWDSRTWGTLRWAGRGGAGWGEDLPGRGPATFRARHPGECHRLA